MTKERESLKNKQNFEKTGVLQNSTKMTMRERLQFYLTRIQIYEEKIDKIEDEISNIKRDIAVINQTIRDFKENVEKEKADNRWIYGTIFGIISLAISIILKVVG